MKVITLDIRDTEAATGLSAATITRMVTAGTFPRPVYVGTRKLFRMMDLEQWAADLQADPPVKKETRGRKRLAV
jgi:predicted DNA-binding transcriptional regulator AlpA